MVESRTLAESLVEEGGWGKNEEGREIVATLALPQWAPATPPPKKPEVQIPLETVISVDSWFQRFATCIPSEGASGDTEVCRTHLSSEFGHTHSKHMATN